LASKNYDGDIFAEIVANGFGVHGLMYNTIYGSNGVIMAEANHGTLVRHYKQW
jgi:isocitrate dehydrogenase